MSRQERREGFRSSGIALAVLAAIAFIAWLSSLAAAAFGWPDFVSVFAAGIVAVLGAGWLGWRDWEGRR